MANALAAVLVLGSAVSMPLFHLAGLTFTGDRILGLIAVLAVGLRALTTGIRWTRIHVALVTFVAVQVLTTLLNAGEWPRGMLLVTVYLLGFACFILTADVASGAAVRRFSAQLFIAVGTVAGLAASLLAVAANLSSTEVWGTTWTLGRASALPAFSAHATFSEPNYLGSFLLIPFALYLWRSPESTPRLFALVAGIVYSCTRAAWLGMGGIVLACLRIRRLPRRAALTVVCVITLAFALLITTAGASAFLQRTVMPFKITRDKSIDRRVKIGVVMLRSWLERPIVGHGAGAGNQLMLPLPDGRTVHDLWAGNAEVHLLQNSGLLGLASFLLVIGVVWRAALRAARRQGEEWARLGVPLTVAGVFLLFSFQFTHALWLMYPYVYLGLLTAELDANEPQDAHSP